MSAAWVKLRRGFSTAVLADDLAAEWPTEGESEAAIACSALVEHRHCEHGFTIFGVVWIARWRALARRQRKRDARRRFSLVFALSFAGPAAPAGKELCKPICEMVTPTARGCTNE